MQSWKWHGGPHPLSPPSPGPAGAESVAQWQWACLSRACMKGLRGGPLLIVLHEKSPGISSSRVSRQLSMSHSTGPTQQGWVALGCALFDFDLPDITSIDEPPSWPRGVAEWRGGGRAAGPGTTAADLEVGDRHIIQGCCWQARDDESSMVRWGPDLITAVICRQPPYPLTTAITSRVIGVHRSDKLLCLLSRRVRAD